MVWSVTARQWHTYTSARLGQPDLMVKGGSKREVLDRAQGAAVVVVAVVPGVSVISIFLIVTFLVGVPSPLDG